MNKNIVLVIDDSDVDQELIHHALKNHKEFHLYSARTGEDGRMAVNELKPDIVLLDYNLPDMDGLNLLLEMAAEQDKPQPVFIMMTGEGNEVLAVNALKAGAKDYLVKSTDGHYLLRLPHVIKAAIHSKVLDAANESLTIQRNLAFTVLNSINEGVAVFNTEGHILSVNRSYVRNSGYVENELINKSIYFLFEWERHPVDYREGLLETLNKNGCWEGEIWQRRKNHSLYLSKVAITALRDGSGGIKEYVCVGTDITAAKQQEDKILFQAFHDGLTGLPNRELLRDRFAFHRAYADRNQTQIAVMFIDLDGFKDVNDCFGHEKGDLLLKQVSNRLLECIRGSDTLARYGGDEFALVLNDVVEQKSVATVAEQLLLKLKQPYDLMGDDQIPISASIGIAMYPSLNRELEWLLDAADEAMYAVKKLGKSNYRFAEADQSH